jgi:hypothetical protein
LREDWQRATKAGFALLPLNRKSVEILVLSVVVLPVVDGLLDALISGGRFRPRRARLGVDLR